MSEIADQHLVFRVSEYNDEAAFVELHNRYYGRIHKLISYKMARPEDAEDIASQVFLNMWEYLTKEEKGKVQNFRAFIYKAARNAVANFYRSQGRIPELVEIDSTEESFEVPDVREDIFKKQLRIEDGKELVASVQKLPEPYREVIVLRFFEELELQEIAEIIGKTYGNIRVMIHRGTQMLKEIMQNKA